MASQKKNVCNRKRISSEVFFNGTTSLTVVENTMIIENSEVVDTKVEQKVYLLKEVSVENILKLRASKKPGLILKKGDSYYYTRIPKNLKFLVSSNVGEHLCRDCQRLSPLDYCQGGCSKVRDLSASTYEFEGFSPKEALEASKRIEKYNFITSGIETFNTNQECLIVLKCNHFNFCNYESHDSIHYLCDEECEENEENSDDEIKIFDEEDFPRETMMVGFSEKQKAEEEEEEEKEDFSFEVNNSFYPTSRNFFYHSI